MGSHMRCQPCFEGFGTGDQTAGQQIGPTCTVPRRTGLSARDWAHSGGSTATTPRGLSAPPTTLDVLRSDGCGPHLAGTSQTSRCHGACHSNPTFAAPNASQHRHQQGAARLVTSHRHHPGAPTRQICGPVGLPACVMVPNVPPTALARNSRLQEPNHSRTRLWMNQSITSRQSSSSSNLLSERVGHGRNQGFSNLLLGPPPIPDARSTLPHGRPPRHGQLPQPCPIGLRDHGPTERCR